MKLIKLEILNLASLDRQDGETINFEEGALGNSTIFSIVGPTGSGKSTLLDAICLALYNRAPRYPKKKGDRKQNIEIYGEVKGEEKNRIAPTDARNILTRGKKKGYSKLTFLANNGHVYRAEWHVKFLTKKYDDAETCLYVINKKGGTLVEEEAKWDELPQIIGLDYDQFLRTVLIAQGSFANFLTAKEDERYLLLEKLVGCEELYKDIANKIKQRKDEASEAHKQISSSFSVYEQNIIPDDELAMFNERIANLETEEKKAKEELQMLSEAISWYTTEDKLTANIMTYQAAFYVAKQKIDELKPEADRLRLHDTTIEAVNLYRDLKNCGQSIVAQEEALKHFETDAAKKEKTISDEQNNLTVLQEKTDRATGELERQKPHINNARKIKTQLQESVKDAHKREKDKKDAETVLKSANDSVKKNQNAIKKAEEDLAKAGNELKALIEEIEADGNRLKEKVEKAKAEFNAESQKLVGKDIAQLQEVKIAAEKKHTGLTNAIRIQTAVNEREKAKHESEEKLTHLLERNEEIDKILKTFDLTQLDEEISTLNNIYTLMTIEDWQLHRSKLHDGEPCPLCGSTHHVYRSMEDVAPVVNGMKVLIDKKKDCLYLKKKEQTALIKEQSENEGTLKSLKKSLTDLNNDIAKLGQEWKSLHEAYPDWQEDVSVLSELLESNQEEKDKAAKELTAYNEQVKAIDRLRKVKEKAETELAEHNEVSVKKKEIAENKKNEAHTHLAKEKAKTENLLLQQQEKTTALQTATEELAKANRVILDQQKDLKAEVGDDDPDRLEESLVTAKESAIRNAKEKSDEILRLKGLLQGIRGKIETTKQAKQKEETMQKEKTASLDSWLAIYNNGNGHDHKLYVDDIALLYASKDDWEAIRSRQNKCTNAFTTAQTTLQNEQKAHQEHQPKKPETDKETLVLRKQELEQRSNEELVNAKARLKNHDDAKQKMGGMFEQMKAADLLKKEWEDISKAIGQDGSQLRKIAQCYTLRFLIEHANVEIRKFNDRYELQQVKNSLGIRVIDHDRADDVRDTTSLSGGETFIVSLGLALGLSALSSRNISFENLFIDEGFGTLDPDMLATVIDSLSMLQSSQGKKVGVISHTDTMSERITTQIRIIKNGSGSSHIEIYP